MKGLTNSTGKAGGGGGGSALDAWPIGSVFTSVTTASPASSIGGVWERFAQGRCLISEGTSDRAFSNGSTGGASAHTISASEMPSHGHIFTPQGSVGSHQHQFTPSGSVDNVYLSGSLGGGGTGGSGSGICSRSGNAGPKQDGNVYEQNQYSVNASHGHGFSGSTGWTSYGGGSFSGSRAWTENQGGGSQMDILQPYIVVYMWRRTG